MGVVYAHISMVELIVSSFLSYFAITDIYAQRIPNRLIIAAAMVFSLVAGVRFIIVFSLAMVLASLMPRFIGGGDMKIICLLLGVYGVTRTLWILMFGLTLSIVMNYGKSFKTYIPLAPYILGGYVCVELFQL